MKRGDKGAVHISINEMYYPNFYLSNLDRFLVRTAWRFGKWGYAFGWTSWNGFFFERHRRDD